MELHDKLEAKFRLDANQKRALHKLKLFSVADLLYHFPVRYSDISEVKKIADLMPGEIATIYGKVSNLKTKKGFRSKIPMAQAVIEDLSRAERMTDGFATDRILYRHHTHLGTHYLKLLAPLGISNAEEVKEVFTTASGDAKADTFTVQRSTRYRYAK